MGELARGDRSVNELVGIVELRQPTISKHLKVLEQAGLVSRTREAQWRPCQLNAGPLKDAAGWIEHYRRFWDGSFERMDAYLAELQAKEAKDHDPSD